VTPWVAQYSAGLDTCNVTTLEAALRSNIEQAERCSCDDDYKIFYITSSPERARRACDKMKQRQAGAEGQGGGEIS